MAGVRLTEAFGALACGHFAFSAIGMSSAFLGSSTTGRPSAAGSGDHQLIKVVSTMYRGGGLDSNACTADVTFTDQAARCVGRSEVCEAFRALRVMKPEHVEEPLCVAKPDGTSEVYLHQRYKLMSSGFTIRSTLVVHRAHAGPTDTYCDQCR